MIMFLYVESQRVAERPPGSSSKLALLLAQSNFYLKMYQKQ